MSKKAKVLPIVILLALFSLFYFYNLNVATALPDDGWGRATQMDGASTYPMQQYSFVEGDKIHTYVPGDKDLRYNVSDENYKKVDESIIPVDADINTPIWGDGQHILYLQDGNLQLYDNGKSAIIDEGVVSFYPGEEEILYWKEKEVFTYKASDNKSSLLITMKDPISHVAAANGDDSVLISTNPTPQDYQFHLYIGKDLLELISWSSFNSASVENILYDSNGQEGSILIESFNMSQGERTNMANLITFTHKDMEVSGNKQMLFADSRTGAKLANPRYFNLRYLDGKREFLFVSEGQREGKKTGYNVYYANATQEGQWIGMRRSTSLETSLNPRWAGDSHILWQTFDGKEYHTFGTYNGNEYVESTMAKTKDDYRTAMYDFISGIFSSFVMIFFGFVWVIPLIIFYAVLTFVRRDDFETDKNWAEPAGVIIYIVTVVFVFNNVLSERLFSLAPAYLTFPYSMVVWPLVIGVVSYFLYKYVTDKDIGLYAGISYYIGLNILMMTGLFGPYLI